MKILVTGANGYLGQGIVKELLDRGEYVIATDLNTDNIDKRAECIPCDILDENKLNEINFKELDVVLHLAWRDGFVHYSDAHIIDLPRHYQFIKYLINRGVSQIAVMGSMHEIGFYEGSINENTPCNPVTPYGIAKNALRQLTQLLCKQHNIIFQWLRGYYIVGNSKYGSSIFSKIADKAEKGEKNFPFTLGQNQYDFIDYKTFCLQVAAAISQKKEQGIINICSGFPMKLAERVELFIKENGYNIFLQYGAFPDRPYDSKAIWGDNSKISKIMKDLSE